jgi:hypothetical protein
MEDWGAEGPDIGPLRFCQTTYGSSLALEFLDVEDKQKFFGVDPDASHGFDFTAWLEVKEDCIEYDGKFYGDWSCFTKED